MNKFIIRERFQKVTLTFLYLPECSGEVRSAGMPSLKRVLADSSGEGFAGDAGEGPNFAKLLVNTNVISKSLALRACGVVSVAMFPSICSNK